MKNQKFKKIVLALLLVMLPIPSFAQVTSDPGFDPNILIDDMAFKNTKSFVGAEGIQKFLEGKGSVLARVDTDFILRLREPGFVDLKTTVEDPNANLGRLRTAAELIWDAAQSTGINPQVILVTLQKEQSLITGHQNSDSAKLQKALDNAMGFDCPDSSGCGDILPGFYFQLFGSVDAEGNRYLGAARSLMKSYNTPNGRGPIISGRSAQVGEKVTLSNTTGYYTTIASQQVTIGNLATAALYRYTPHVYNGNYNFWKYFTTWFKLQEGTLVVLPGDSNTYIILNGGRLIVPPFVARARKLNVSAAQNFSPTELENYPSKGYLPPLDNAVYRTSGRYYVFIDGVKHAASEYILKQRGLNMTNIQDVTEGELSLYADGGALTPSEGTVLKGDSSADLYLVMDGKLRKFTELTKTQYGAVSKQQVIPQAELDTYPKAGSVPPVDGTLIKTSDAKYTYIVDKGLKRPVFDTVFANLGLKKANVKIVSSDEFNSVPTTGAATPKEETVVKTTGSGQYFYFKNGQKHLVSAYVLKQRKMWADINVADQVANEWYSGLSLPPKDGTVVKGNKKADVYIVEGGKLRIVTASEFTKKKLKSKVQVLPQAEVDGYVKSIDSNQASKATTASPTAKK